MTTKQTTSESIDRVALSSLELEELMNASRRHQIAAMELRSAESAQQTVLKLIGDRYGIDPVNERFQLLNEELVRVKETERPV